MKTQKHLQIIWTSISLVILTLGFSFLGLVAFISGDRELVFIATASEKSYAIVGSSISVLVGATFLVTVAVYLNRYSRDKH
jgi:uncharacterized membrane protein